MGNRLSAYSDALEYLFVRTTGQWRFGLERTQALLSELGDPHRQMRIIHVGGTNGKGSVCATIERVLRDRGFRVAKYTSPHLIDFRERFLIDGLPVTEEAVVEFIREWTPAVERIGASFFEATTAMAFTLFARATPDIAIIEVGLGGRLDATNVVDPMMAIVTNIGIDHTEYLGDTREAIAMEKAGIFKRDRAAVIGERDPRIASLLVQHAVAAGAAPVDVVHGVATVQTSLVGEHQAENTAVALRALAMLPSPWQTSHDVASPSLLHVRLAGRFDQRDGMIFDVAHNPDGAIALANTLRLVAPVRPRTALLSVLGDKDWRGMMTALSPEVDEFVLTTAPTSPASRAWDPATAERFATDQGWRASVELDFDRALARVRSRGATAIITGSFHTVGDAMARLHLSPFAE